MPDETAEETAGGGDGWRSWLGRFFGCWMHLRQPDPDRAVELGLWSPESLAGEGSLWCPRCGEPTGRGEVTARGCGSCRGRRLPFDRTVRLGVYEEPLAGWIRQFKYQPWPAVGRRLGAMLGRSVADVLDREYPDMAPAVVPMPMPWPRRVHRGIDHAMVLAEAVGRATGGPVLPVLKRANGPPQVGRTAAQRRESGRAGLSIGWIPGGVNLTGAVVVLVDDVRTTGASLEAAGRLLRDCGAQDVVASVLAVNSLQRREAAGEGLSDASTEGLGRLISKNREETLQTR